ncbi:MAG TPA: dihydrolipoamide acetyltransferase family protein [Candidatus Binataceae bacterium]|nr:dihydrolipoamide acetyltransferase family protein [Candidatus Binataceae bacterium]
MPMLGADMEVGTIIQWLVKPGDAIKRGDIIAVVDTEKATIEVEVFQTGIIEALIVGEGEKVPVGTVLARIAAGEAAPPPRPAPAAPKPAAAPPKPVAVAARPAPPPPRVAAPPPPPVALRPPVPPPKAAPPGRLRISPLAMRVAIDLQVDLSKVKGTGPSGAITRADIERAAARPAEAVAPAEAARAVPEVAAPAPLAAVAEAPKAVPRPTISPADRQASMRRAIAAAMARSKREIPHYYLGTTVDMSRALPWLQAENLKRPVDKRLLYSVLLLKAVALAVRQVPEMNGFWIEGAFKPSEAVHVGIAISLRQGGLIAPAIHDVDGKSLDDLMVNLRDLVKRVRAGVLRSSEIADATITVTSLGEQGVESVFGIIYPPQVALVGFGKVVERPWAANGMIGVRPVINTSLAADHRASDGHRGGLFLAAIDRLLQEPEKL